MEEEGRWREVKEGGEREGGGGNKKIGVSGRQDGGIA